MDSQPIYYEVGLKLWIPNNMYDEVGLQLWFTNTMYD